MFIALFVLFFDVPLETLKHSRIVPQLHMISQVIMLQFFVPSVFFVFARIKIKSCILDFQHWYFPTFVFFVILKMH